MAKKNWKKTTNEAFHGYTEEKFVNKKDGNSVVLVSKKAGTVASDQPETYHKWYVNWDSMGSDVFGERVYFDTKKQAKEFAKLLMSESPAGFHGSWRKALKLDVLNAMKKTGKVS